MDAPQAQGQPQGGGASELVMSIASGIEKLSQMIQGSDQVDDDDKQAIAAIEQQFHAFVDGLGGAKAPGPKGPVSPEAGVSGAQPAM